VKRWISTDPALRSFDALAGSRRHEHGMTAVNLMLGGPIIAGATLSRFFALHVFVVPGLLIAFVGLHLLMVLKLGINEWPMPGRIVRRATYMQDRGKARDSIVSLQTILPLLALFPIGLLSAPGGQPHSLRHWSIAPEFRVFCTTEHDSCFTDRAQLRVDSLSHRSSIFHHYLF
jgi:hypothetical protein